MVNEVVIIGVNRSFKLCRLGTYAHENRLTARYACCVGYNDYYFLVDCRGSKEVDLGIDFVRKSGFGLRLFCKYDGARRFI